MAHEHFPPDKGRLAVVAGLARRNATGHAKTVQRFTAMIAGYGEAIRAAGIAVSVQISGVRGGGSLEMSDHRAILEKHLPQQRLEEEHGGLFQHEPCRLAARAVGDGGC
jgi:hypothetical protein